MARELQEIIEGINTEANKYKDLGILQAEAFKILKEAQSKKYREFTSVHASALRDWNRTHPAVFAQLTSFNDLPVEELRNLQPSALRDLQINGSKISFWSYCKQSVALAIQIMEVIFDKHKREVEEIITTTEIGTRPWYLQQAFNYQHGDKLLMVNNLLRYETIDDKKKIIKKAGIIEKAGAELLFKALKSNNNTLSADEMIGFRIYMNSIKILGTKIDVISLPAEGLSLDIKVYLDGEIFNSNGKTKATDEPLVDNAIKEYLEAIPIDGIFRKIALIDNIQSVKGVLDVNIISANVGGTVIDREYESTSGHFKLNLTPGVSYIIK